MKRTGLCLRFRGEMLGFLLCSLLGLISMAGFALQNHGFFYILSDFNTQQIPFTISLHQYLENSPVSGWLWNYELGHSVIQAYGFYALGSPFFWLSMLFPAGWFPYIISLFYVFKYGAAGFTACMFLKRFSRNRLHVLTGYRDTKDNDGSTVSRTFLGTDGMPVEIPAGYSEIRYFYDDMKQLSSVRYYDLNGKQIQGE